MESPRPADQEQEGRVILLSITIVKALLDLTLVVEGLRGITAWLDDLLVDVIILCRGVLGEPDIVSCEL